MTSCCVMPRRVVRFLLAAAAAAAWCCCFFLWFLCAGLLVCCGLGSLTHTCELSSLLLLSSPSSSLLLLCSFFAGVYAVIAANMCKQIVALQTVLETISSEYPGAFSGYSLKVEESHQSRKADTSGTAKEMIK